MFPVVSILFQKQETQISWYGRKSWCAGPIFLGRDTLPLQESLSHKPGSQECMIWYVGQYPFWSEQWVRYVLLLCCHSDYWGDREGLSWSGMREPAVWDSYTIAATITAWKPHSLTHTHTDNWGTSHSLFRGTDPCSRVLMCVCWMSSARCNNQTLECVIKQSFSERRLEGVIRSCRNDAKWVFKEPLVKLEANTTSQKQLNEFTTMTALHHMHNLASINRI